MKVAFFNSKTGTTLIEVMIALIIIGIIIIGGGMFFFHGRVNIVREAHRRAAVLVASQRLEALKAVKAADWDDIARDPSSYEPYCITYNSSSGWVKNLLEDEKDTGVAVENLSDGEMLTKARWMDDDPDDVNQTYDYLKVTVTVEWRDSTTNSVSSTTLIAPP